jgi:NADPH:quinone reductase-like Zn-dependent oxidoreductase
MAAPLGSVTQRQCERGFQLYTIVPAKCATSIPDNMSFEEAAKLPIGVLTATAGLFESKHLAMPLPSTTPKPSGKTLLVWGGSSNVGAAVVQLAVASGLEVVATASKHNHDFVRSIGASEVFEHGDPEVADKLEKCLKSKDLVGAFDCKLAQRSSHRHIHADCTSYWDAVHDHCCRRGAGTHRQWLQDRHHDSSSAKAVYRGRGQAGYVVRFQGG